MERLQYISQGKTYDEQLNNIKNVLAAGGKWVQLRWKNANYDDFLRLAHVVKELCVYCGAVFIVNDSVEIAKNVDADGVHLGLTDMSIKDARTILGTEKIIGGTANTLEDVIKRTDENCDYIGLGPLRFTTNKENLSPILGFEGYATIFDELSKQGVKYPNVFAIGSITSDDVIALREIGLYGVAVSGSLTHNVNIINLFNDLLLENVEDCR